MDRVILYGGSRRKPLLGEIANNRHLVFDESKKRDEIVIGLRAKVLALFIFLFFFIENRTLGIFPESMFVLYRNVRLSDLILYGLVAYSLYNVKEYRYMFKSRAFLLVKIMLVYMLFEFGLSFLRYKFNILEYFFRLKGPWSSFLVFPFMLLLQRKGFPFLIKLVLPFAVFSNILYIMTSLTGIAFLPGLDITTQVLPGGLTVVRVYGGTFYGEYFFLGFVYLWLTKRFKFYQLPLAILFIIPHVLAFGRSAWVNFAFTIFMMGVFVFYKQRRLQILVRQGIVFTILGIASVYSFIRFVPESDYYIAALNSRIFQAEEDVKYDEGTYGTRIGLQNEVLLKLFVESNWLVGVGMHPMWVVGPQSHEEVVYYAAFSDVSWSGVLAAYGAIGFIIWMFLQAFLIIVTFRLLKQAREYGLQTFILLMLFTTLLFSTFVCYSYLLFTANIWGISGINSFFVAMLVYSYEKEGRDSGKIIDSPQPYNNYDISSKYYKYSYKYDKAR